MKVFIWKEVLNATRSYHSEGGVIVFAETEERARELANQQDGCTIETDEKPDYVRDTLGHEEAVFIMPNAGCC